MLKKIFQNVNIKWLGKIGNILNCIILWRFIHHFVEHKKRILNICRISLKKVQTEKVISFLNKNLFFFSALKKGFFGKIQFFY
jgi:hypothetical protein